MRNAEGGRLGDFPSFRQFPQGFRTRPSLFLAKTDAGSRLTPFQPLNTWGAAAPSPATGYGAFVATSFTSFLLRRSDAQRVATSGEAPPQVAGTTRSATDPRRLRRRT